ncbi:MAG: hypothetical protein ACRC2O_11665 [Chitinophagaceae bacterium]
MNSKEQNLEALKEIRSMMDRSSRFISLSGWSGILAGISALIGVWIAKQKINSYYEGSFSKADPCPDCLRDDLIFIAVIVFISAFTSAIFLTYLKSRKDSMALWGSTAKRLMWHTLLPMVAGGFLLWRMMDLRQFELVAPASLIFYGLALVNGSKFTVGEVRFLGYAIIATGIFNLWAIGYSLECWAFGFGILHIIYGFTMWLKYEKKS